jgi:hypothetical protein
MTKRFRLPAYQPVKGVFQHHSEDIKASLFLPAGRQVECGRPTRRFAIRTARMTEHDRAKDLDLNGVVIEEGGYR